MTSGQKLVEAAKWAKEHPTCEGCPLEEDEACIVVRDPQWGMRDVTVCEIADVILAAYECGRREEFERHDLLRKAAEHILITAIPDADKPVMIHRVASNAIEMLRQALLEVEDGNEDL